ncbi:MAG: class I SAM-dependent methyltransferase [Dehalococcoidia bacterium]|nr:class I SAM-dependent methyltransferase [Dehalococcoidia bacterium]
MTDKAAYVHRAFTAIARRYDLLNTLLSFNQDRRWRRATASALEIDGSVTVLDVATGTGKLASELERKLGADSCVVGIDFCEPMLRRARCQTRSTALLLAASEKLPFADECFDGTTVGFALRNVPDMEKTLREMVRVTKAGGKVVCLEFSRPKNPIMRGLHRAYLMHILPLVGWLVSGDKEAYVYLPRSIMEFPSAEGLRGIMQRAGLQGVRFRFLTCGVVAIHIGTKPHQADAHTPGEGCD